MASSTNVQLVTNVGASIFGRWTTAQAVDTYLHTNKIKIPADTDPTYFRVVRPVVIVDAIAGSAAPTGTIQLVEEGNPTNYYINVASHLASNSGRPRLSIPLYPGKTYEWVTKTAMSAGD